MKCKKMKEPNCKNFIEKSKQYDIIDLLFGETGENPVRARRRDVHIILSVLPDAANRGNGH